MFLFMLYSHRYLFNMQFTRDIYQVCYFRVLICLLFQFFLLLCHSTWWKIKKDEELQGKLYLILCFNLFKGESIFKQKEKKIKYLRDQKQKVCSLWTLNFPRNKSFVRFIGNCFQWNLINSWTNKIVFPLRLLI